MPMLLSVVVMSASVYVSNRLSGSSVKMTNGAGVCRHYNVSQGMEAPCADGMDTAAGMMRPGAAQLTRHVAQSLVL